MQAKFEFHVKVIIHRCSHLSYEGCLPFLFPSIFNPAQNISLMKLRGLILIGTLLFLFTSVCFSQKPSSSGESSRNKKNNNNAPSSTEKVSEQFYWGMKWRSIGPYQGGRSLTASGVIGDPLTYYFGATGGGVWKTIDGGN